MKKDTLYLYLSVYKKENTLMFCYRVFQDLSTELFYVQSKDNISNGDTMEFSKQIVELFIETEPKKREKGYKSMEEAINIFDNDFNNF